MERKSSVNPWLETRKEEYIRDMVEDFFHCKEIFDIQWKKFREKEKIDWETMEQLIGTAEKKGELWNLKDLTHSLLDRPYPRLTHEFAFERCIHLLFHNLMSLKEHIYVIYQYRDILSRKPPQREKELTLAMKNFQEMIATMEEEIPQEMELAHRLFEIAKNLLRIILIKLKNNPLIIKFVIEEKKTLEKHFGKGECMRILHEMFSGHPEEGKKLLEKWYEARGIKKKIKL